MTKDFYKYDFHDAVIEKIEINCNETVLYIDMDGTKTKIICRDTVGVTNLCMWEDDEIYDARLNKVEDFSLPFLENIKKSHPTYGEAGQNPVRDGLFDLAVELANNIVFHIYCYSVDVKSEFPNYLDEAKVISDAELETPETLYYTDGDIWCKIYYYAICKYEKYDSYYLFGCTEDFSVESDDAFESVEECKSAFSEKNLNWILK
ncbi:MAG: hypothetical protein IJX27_01780 [Clostridia bacterium]|nr:hypothetical protein [Clostridia bacterium]